MSAADVLQQQDEALRRVEAVLAAFLRTTGIPSGRVAVVHHGRQVGARGFGIADADGQPVGPDTLFRVGSLTKSVTAVAVLQLRDSGLILLDAPVRRYLPWFRLAGTTSDGVSVRHLLTHTSGIPASASTSSGRTPTPSGTRWRPACEPSPR